MLYPDHPVAQGDYIYDEACPGVAPSEVIGHVGTVHRRGRCVVFHLHIHGLRDETHLAASGTCLGWLAP